MAQQIITIFLGLVLICTQYLTIVNACSCMPHPEKTSPNYCRTAFLALVKLTHSVLDNAHGQQHNYFELIRDVSDFGEVKRSTLKGSIAIDDSTSSCGHFLQGKGDTYLIGGFLDANGQHPHLTPCNSWIEKWDYTAEQTTARLAEYKAKCGPVALIIH